MLAIKADFTQLQRFHYARNKYRLAKRQNQVDDMCYWGIIAQQLEEELFLIEVEGGEKKCIQNTRG